MQKFHEALEEILDKVKTALREACILKGAPNEDYYGYSMLENEDSRFCVDGHKVKFINEAVIIAEDEQHYNHEAMDISDYLLLVDALI